MIVDERIDGGTPFDWGKVSADYAKYRDIYPPEFYRMILNRGLCRDGQHVLDLGTGTGVLPRNMARYGASWTGIDVSGPQIEQARLLSKGMDIEYRVSKAEDAVFPDGSFDVVTACQCFWYFNHEMVCERLHRLLKPGGTFLVMVMEWLPFEDPVAGASERLILKYSPHWSGAGERMHPIDVPGCYLRGFELVHHEERKLEVPFTRESWNGRMKACRGVGASLDSAQVAAWEREHMALLERIAPPRFEVLHYAAMAELRRI
ncbi:class I SAM-dependent methyltransferase [Bifidobacterium reuteri]|uniref:Methyltransferase domain protein n=2 Tax=Bifidobacterium reuteri TaxID=983706 RepID=A0A087CUP3_9BIFI|nr:MULTISPECIES: class I SAM-dependent methyltransferase [Bifidobacterium]KAA8826158.1 class I SAM-dependent methyltransferase [Bifidobacterium reuteri]KFI86993.1 methyltransferase domain protein [Bifidobacterium reuteri DSM 23975]